MGRPKGSKNKSKVQGVDYWINRPLNDKQKDWGYGEENWIEGYVLSLDHPHRGLIVNALKSVVPFGGVLEIGCNTGSNLIRVRELWPQNQLAGIDVNGECINIASEYIPGAILEVADYNDIPFKDKEFDILIADAVLLYANPDEIETVMNEIDRVTKKAVIMIERYADSLTGEIVGHVWGRDYKKLLEQKGFKVTETPLTEDQWPTSQNWILHGRLYIAVRV